MTPSPTTVRTGRSGCAMRRPIAAGSAKPSMPIALTKPSGSVAAIRACSSGRLDGVSSTSIASRGRRSASAASTWPARSGSPSAGGAGGAGRCHGAPAGSPRASTASASAAQIAAGSPSTASSTGLRCASSGSCVTTAIARAGVHQRAAVERVLAQRAGADDQHDVVRGEHVAQAGATGGQVAGELRDGPAGSRPAPPNGSWKTGHAKPLGERAQRAPAGVAVGAGTGDDRRRLGAREQLGERVDGGRVGGGRAQQRVPARSSRAPRARGRASRPSARSRSPGRGRSRPRGRRARSRPGRPAGARAGRSTPGTRPPGRAAGRPGTGRARGGGGPAGRRSRPRAARGSSARSPARRPRCRARASSAAGRATERRARSRARPPSPTTDPSCSASTNCRSSGSPARNGTSVEPGLEKIVVSSRRRRTSNVASRTVGDDTT